MVSGQMSFGNVSAQQTQGTPPPVKTEINVKEELQKKEVRDFVIEQGITDEEIDEIFGLKEQETDQKEYTPKEVDIEAEAQRRMYIPTGEILKSEQGRDVKPQSLEGLSPEAAELAVKYGDMYNQALNGISDIQSLHTKLKELNALSGGAIESSNLSEAEKQELFKSVIWPMRDKAQQVVTQSVEAEALYNAHEKDKEKFGKAAAKEWGHLLPEGTDTEKWFDERFRSDFNQPYIIDPELKKKGVVASYITSPGANGHGQIVFSDRNYAYGDTHEITRAHENVHKITNFALEGGQKDSRTGVHVSRQFGFEQKGIGFNEGATNIMAERLADEKSVKSDFSGYKSSYPQETQIARQVMEITGEDAFFSGMLIDSQILMEKYDGIAGKGSYNKLLDDTDNLYRLNEKARSQSQDRNKILDNANGVYENIQKDILAVSIKQTQQELADAKTPEERKSAQDKLASYEQKLKEAGMTRGEKNNAAMNGMVENFKKENNITK